MNSLTLSVLPSALSVPEQARLTDCEIRIERGISVFMDVGTALLEIRDSRLYRQQFPTFEAYCRERWGMGKAYAHRMIAAAEVVSALSPIGDILPATESQARPLTRLEPEVQREVWREVVETTPPEQITAKVVEEKAKAAQPLNETIREIKAEISAPAAPLFPANPEITKAAQQTRSGVVSLVEAARKVRKAEESIPPQPVQPLHDLEGINPHLYARATTLQGSLRRLSEFCRAHAPAEIAGAFKAHEKPDLKKWVSEISGWATQFVNHL